MTDSLTVSSFRQQYAAHRCHRSERSLITRYTPYWLQPSFIGKGHMPVIAHDDVIQHPNAEEVSGLHEPLGEGAVFLARGRVPTWMVVLCDVSNYVEFLHPDAAAPA